MNTIIRFLSGMILLMFCAVNSYGQQVQNPPKKYRVVAVDSERSEITSISNIIELYYPLALQIPTAFTPNGDGLNDTFGPVGEGAEIFRMVVFNRWGNILFTSNDINNHWDGIYNGEPVPFGAYTYEIFAEGKEIGKIHKSGQVIVAR
jgi:gliding motility-associated-like protein